MKPSKAEPIRDYILKDKETFGIAAEVATAWRQAREQIVTKFLEKLDFRLKRKLKGWQSEPFGGQFFEDPYPGYYIWNKQWKHHSVGFQCAEYGGRMDIGVSRDTDNARKLPFHPPVLVAIQGILPGSKSYSWWEARAPMHSPEPDWRTPEALWRMDSDKAFLKDVADQLLAIAAVSEPIINRLYRVKRS